MRNYSEIRHNSELGAIFLKYNLNDSDKEGLKAYIKNSIEGFEAELEDKDFAWEKLPYDSMTKNAQDFFAEICNFTIAWHYSTEDCLELDKELLKMLDIKD